MSKTILVTGGTGFTGSRLVLRLLDRGHRVRVLDNKPGLFAEELRSRGAELHLASITDQKVVGGIAQDCDVVYHLAAAFRELGATKRHYWHVNVEGTRIVADAAFQCRVARFIYCSTQGVHGHIAEPPGDESSPIAPEDYYQLTKYEGEKVVLEYVRRGLDALILRPTAIYGPGDPARFLMLFRMVRRGTFYMFGDGKTFYHPVHVDNLVDAFELAASADSRLAGQAYLIGDHDYWTLNELVQHVAEAMGISVRIRHLPYWPLWCAACACEIACKPFRIAPPLFRRRVNWFRQNRAFKITKAVRDLGYQPRVNLAEGLRQTGRWYKENNYL